MADAFRQLGYVEGKNLTFERRYAEDRLDRLPRLAAELVSLEVEVIMAVGTLAPLAAKQATSTIPIVMMSAGDPIGSGLVASLAHPSGNVTGMSLMAPDLGGKRLELLKELLPELSRVAILWNAANPYSALVFKETVGAAQTLELGLQSLEIRELPDPDGALEAATGQHAEALITVEDPLTIDLRKKIAEFAADHRLPAISGLRLFADSGFLMSYGADVTDYPSAQRGVCGQDPQRRETLRPACRAANQVRAGHQSKTAKSLGLTIPALLLARADEVIE